MSEPDVKIANKQYLLMVDELTMACLGKVFPGMKYVEIEGMTMVDKPTHQILVNPLPIPKEEEKQEEVLESV